MNKWCLRTVYIGPHGGQQSEQRAAVGGVCSIEGSKGLVNSGLPLVEVEPYLELTHAEHAA